jgi:hypothetical protein
MRPVWSFPYIQENYTGPYLSNGKFQESIAYGDVEPKSQLDAISRDHDTMYALSQDYEDPEENRHFADYIYFKRAFELDGLVPKIAAVLVKQQDDIRYGVTRLANFYESYNGNTPLARGIGILRKVYNTGQVVGEIKDKMSHKYLYYDNGVKVRLTNSKLDKINTPNSGVIENRMRDDDYKEMLPKYRGQIAPDLYSEKLPALQLRRHGRMIPSDDAGQKTEVISQDNTLSDANLTGGTAFYNPYLTMRKKKSKRKVNKLHVCKVSPFC